MDSKFSAHPPTAVDKQTSGYLMVDESGSLFFTDSYRWTQPVTADPGDLAHAADALHLSAAATITLLARDNDTGDTPVALALPAGITKLGVRRVTAISTGTVTALYLRRPEGA